MTDRQRSTDESVIALFRPVQFEFVDDAGDDHAGAVETVMPSPLQNEAAAQARSYAFRSWLSEHPDANG